jgi:hypothetical protein
MKNKNLCLCLLFSIKITEEAKNPERAANHFFSSLKILHNKQSIALYRIEKPESIKQNFKVSKL